MKQKKVLNQEIMHTQGLSACLIRLLLIPCVRRVRVIFFSFFSILSFLSFAQNADSIRVQRMQEAKDYLKGVIKPYNPQKALDLYSVYANVGDPVALLSITYLYQSGKISDSKEIYWLEKSANAGNAESWYDLGMAYKYAKGVKQDFVKAYQCFDKAAELQYSSGYYVKGYMLYKGLGCTQDYYQAVINFQKSSLTNKYSMYMLGLCYRNGYGTKVDLEKAKYWLEQALVNKCEFAKDEIEETLPENTGVDIKTLINSFSDSLDNIQTADNIESSVPLNNLKGTFKGSLITADWSGQRLVSRSEVTLSINQNSDSVSGVWSENDRCIPFVASTTDSSLAFANTSYVSSGRYDKNPIDIIFKRANIKAVQTSFGTFIIGQLYRASAKTAEPLNPCFISLFQEKNQNVDTSHNSILGIKNLPTVSSSDTGIISHLAVFPNPFVSNISITFDAKEDCNLSVWLVNARTGVSVYSTRWANCLAGFNSVNLNLQIQSGDYILKIVNGNEVKSSIIIKK